MKISTIFILNLPKYDPFGDVRDDVPEAPGNLDHLIHFVVCTLNYLSFKFHNDMTNTLATIYCHRSLPPKSNFWRFKTTVPPSPSQAGRQLSWPQCVRHLEYIHIVTIRWARKISNYGKRHSMSLDKTFPLLIRKNL